MKTKFATGHLGITTQVVFSCFQNQQIRVDKIWVNNSSGSNRTFNLHHVSKGETAEASNSMIYEAIIRSNTSAYFDGPFYFEPGDSLQANCSAASAVNVFVYGDIA